MYQSPIRSVRHEPATVRGHGERDDPLYLPGLWAGMGIGGCARVGTVDAVLPLVWSAASLYSGYGPHRSGCRSRRRGFESSPYHPFSDREAVMIPSSASLATFQARWRKDFQQLDRLGAGDAPLSRPADTHHVINGLEADPDDAKRLHPKQPAGAKSQAMAQELLPAIQQGWKTLRQWLAQVFQGRRA